MEIEDVIEQLKQLDLTTYPKDQILDLFNKIGPMASIVVTFHKGKSVIRARPNYNGERFTKKSDFSYKPQEFNQTYQRASTPNTTMFYATAIPDTIEPGELDNMRIIGLVESLPLMRDMNKSCFQTISFGRWKVEEDLNLLAIVHKETYHKESSYTRELIRAYHSFSENVDVEIHEKSLKFQTYLADEFSKEVIRGDYDYMISALFSERLTQRGYDGVIYPSVRVGGKGFNIAITPESTKKLRLSVAGECSLYKQRDNSFVGNEAQIELNGDEEEFEMIESENNRELILQKLGVNSIEDLING